SALIIITTPDYLSGVIVCLEDNKISSECDKNQCKSNKYPSEGNFRGVFFYLNFKIGKTL
ncbi:TPA: hypothetical protein ACQ1D1_000834, partial [Haemophilus influenzae]